jgi:hypothetical protein
MVCGLKLIKDKLPKCEENLDNLKCDYPLKEGSNQNEICGSPFISEKSIYDIITENQEDLEMKKEMKDIKMIYEKMCWKRKKIKIEKELEEKLKLIDLKTKVENLTEEIDKCIEKIDNDMKDVLKDLNNIDMSFKSETLYDEYVNMKNIVK